MSSKKVPDTGNDSGLYSWQLDSDGRKLRWRSATGDSTSNKVHTTASTKYPKNQWSHAVFVKRSDGSAEIYMNGSSKATTANQPTPLDKLKIGTNRRNELPWKGYIDEFKIYKRALDSTDVCDLFKNDGPLNDGATCP